MTHRPTSPLNLRQAVRALVFDERHDVLLVRFEFPTATVWTLPGGGLEPDEQPEAGLRRELREELGLTDVEIGPHIWNREHVIPMLTGHDGQRDRIHIVHTRRFEPAPEIGWEALRAELVHEIRWWSLDAIEATAGQDVLFAPRRLAALAREILERGLPELPVDTGL